MHGCFGGGACMVAPGVCVVALGGHVWFYSGGHAWFYSGGACMVLFRGGMRGFFSFFGYNEIRSMSGRYASYWNGMHSCIVFFFCQETNNIYLTDPVYPPYILNFQVLAASIICVRLQYLKV